MTGGARPSVREREGGKRKEKKGRPGGPKWAGWKENKEVGPAVEEGNVTGGPIRKEKEK